MTRRHPSSTLFPYTTLFRSEIVAYYEEQVTPDDAFLVITGDVTVEQGLELAETTFGDWETSGNDQEGKGRKSTRLNSSHSQISYAVFCLKKKNATETPPCTP